MKKILSATGIVQELRTLIHYSFREEDTAVLKGFEFGCFLHKIQVVTMYDLDHNTVLIGSRMLAQAFRAEFQLQQLYSFCSKYFSWFETLQWSV